MDRLSVNQAVSSGMTRVRRAVTAQETEYRMEDETVGVAPEWVRQIENEPKFDTAAGSRSKDGLALSVVVTRLIIG